MTGKDDKEEEEEQVNKYWLELETQQVEFSAKFLAKFQAKPAHLTNFKVRN